MLSKRFANDDKSHINLNQQQKKQRDRIKFLIKSQQYTFKEYPCIICNSTQFEDLAYKDRYGLPNTTAICQQCGLVQTTPRMTQEAYNHFYNDGHRKLYVGSRIPTEKYISERIKSAQKITKYLQTHLSLSGMHVLEIGCGIGALLNELKKHGATVEGIDPSTTYLEAGRKHFNLNLHTTDLFQINPPKAYDLIIYSDVFEHLLSPGDHLQKCQTLLNQNGTLFIKVPGIRNILRPYLNDFLLMLQNAHITYFSADTLTNLLQQHNFKSIHINERIQSLWKPHKQTTSTPKNNYIEIKRFLKKKEKQEFRRAILSTLYHLKKKLIS